MKAITYYIYNGNDKKLLDMNANKTNKRIVLIILGIMVSISTYAQHTTSFKFSETAPEYVLRNMERNANALFSEINKKYDLSGSVLDISKCSTASAQERINGMWKVRHFYCTRTSVVTRVLKMVSSDTYQVRNIPVCYPGGDSQEYQYQFVILEFDKSGMITDFYCSLPEHELVIPDDNPVPDLRHREQINNFISNFFTAYNCKDIDLIEKMYSEDALIITGKVINYKTNRNNELSKTLTNNPKIEYSIQNKKEYITRLKGVFERNDYINIKFDGVEIAKSEANPKVYWVRLNQYWHVSKHAKESGYYDEGKLFLIIDFTNEDRPEIWVRAWQPFQDANGKQIHYTENEYFSIGDFAFE